MKGNSASPRSIPERAKLLWFPALLFLVALLADHTVTQRGIQAGGQEGNVVVAWLWEILPFSAVGLVVLWCIVVVVCAFFLARRHVILGLWLLFGAFIGHFTGFLSWISPPVQNILQWLWDMVGPFGGLLVQAAVWWIAGGWVLASIFAWVMDE